VNTRTPLLLLALFALALWGCPSDDDDATVDDDTAPDDDSADDDDDVIDDDDSGGDDDAEPLDPCVFPENPAASIKVLEDYYDENEYSRVKASVMETPYPPFHDPVLEEGDCRHLEMNFGFCDPPCAPMTEVCIYTNECVPYPAGVSAGDLTVNGLDEPIFIECGEWCGGYYWGPWDLPPDLFGEGDPISASFTGDVFPAVDLNARGVAPMDHDLATSGLTLLDGQDNVVSWTPSSDPDACVELMINTSNIAHGLPYSDVLWCVTTDSGSLTIPQAIVESFPHGSTEVGCVTNDCPLSELTRFTHQSESLGQGPAELVVRHTTFYLYDHPAP